MHELGHRGLILLVQQLEQASTVRFAHRIENKICTNHHRDVTYAS